MEMGFYGKLPGYGDFITRRLPSDFQDRWHDWLTTGLGTVRDRLGEGWLPFYLNCPAWKFVTTGGVFGEQPVAGVTIPSIDRVGRYFNFTLVALLPPGTRPAAMVNGLQDWYGAVEDLALRTLEEELDQDQVDVALEEIVATAVLPPAPEIRYESGAAWMRCADAGLAGPVDQLSHMVDNLVAARYPQHSFWWHGGSTNVAAQLVCCENAPDGELFLGMMAGEDAVSEQAGGQADEPEVDYLDQLLGDEPEQ